MTDNVEFMPDWREQERLAVDKIVHHLFSDSEIQWNVEQVMLGMSQEGIFPEDPELSQIAEFDHSERVRLLSLAAAALLGYEVETKE